MKRFILAEKPDRTGAVRLSGEDYHYLVRVRRLAAGECFPALLPDGTEVLIRITSTEGGVLSGICVQENADTAVAAAGSSAAGIPPIILFQALPKGEKMDLIVRQAAEGGLSEVVPFASEYSIPKLRGRDNAIPAKYSRWERILREARQQSGSPVATALGPAMSIAELFDYWEGLKKAGALGLLFHHTPLTAPDCPSPLAQPSLHGYLDNCPEKVVVAIGPEGGFSAAEAERFLEAGFKPLTIGDTVLRTETAALYAAAAVRIILLERNSWEMKLRQAGNG